VQVTTTNFLSKLRAVVRQHDAPVSTISYYAHWLLMEQIAACGYRIAVSGTAADEVFSGYYDHHLAYLADTQNQPEIHGPAVAAWRTHVQPIVRTRFSAIPTRSCGIRHCATTSSSMPASSPVICSVTGANRSPKPSIPPACCATAC
jgi:hypothetical protein